MSLIQPLKFKTLETEHFKTPRLQIPCFQMGFFQMVVTDTYGLRSSQINLWGKTRGEKLAIFVDKQHYLSAMRKTIAQAKLSANYCLHSAPFHS